MKKKLLIVLVIWLSILACQVIPTPPPLTPTPEGRNATPSPVLPEAKETDSPGRSTAPPGELAAPAFELSSIEPFPEKFFAETTAINWVPTDSNMSWYDLPIDLQTVANPGVLAGLTNAQKRYLAQNGFLLIQSPEKNFSVIRHKVSAQYGQPYFLTLDAAGYALKSTADALLIALEREELAGLLAGVVQSTLVELQSYLPGLQGSSLEKDARLALVYLSVGLHLLDPSTQFSLEPDLDALYRAQVEQVLNATGVASLLLMPTVQLDFDAFIVPEIYLGDEVLEAYHRGRTWFEQVGFPLDDRPGIQASRAPLMISLAMRRASYDGKASAQLWARLDETMAFFYGRTQDDDPRRYAQLMDRVYGNRISVLALEDDQAWQVFQVLAQTLPAERAYSALAGFPEEQPGAHNWRFLGRRTIKDAIVFSVLPVMRDHTPDLPHQTASGLDWMAISGWQKAEEILDSYLVMQTEAYASLFKDLQHAVQLEGEEQWQATFWGAWNYAFLPVKQAVENVTPPFMKQTDWKQKDLISALGSWAISHHRSGEIAGNLSTATEKDMPFSNPAPAYVQPAPEVFYRLSYLANVIVDGLTQRQMTGQQENMGLAARMQEMRDLGDRLARLGDISVKEIQGLPLESSDFAVIQAPLGPVDQVNTIILSQNPEETLPVVAIGVAAEKKDSVLHAGIGWLDWLYVVVPIGEQLQVAQGGVFSYYEFNQLSSERLNDDRWRWIVMHAQPERPMWASVASLPGGSPYFVLVFRTGDIYRITPAGTNLSVRSESSRIASTVQRLRAGDRVKLIEGPVEAEGSTWWKISILEGNGTSTVTGWVIQNQDWFERVWD